MQMTRMLHSPRPTVAGGRWRPKIPRTQNPGFSRKTQVTHSPNPGFSRVSPRTRVFPGLLCCVLFLSSAVHTISKADRAGQNPFASVSVCEEGEGWRAAAAAAWQPWYSLKGLVPRGIVSDLSSKTEVVRPFNLVHVLSNRSHYPHDPFAHLHAGIKMLCRL